MKIESFEELIHWTRDMHGQLSRRLGECADEQAEARAKWLLSYLSDHEALLERTVSLVETMADPKALNTLVYEWGLRTAVDVTRPGERNYAALSFDGICEEIFAIHNQIIELYRYLLGRAEIPEVRDMLEELLDLEEHETMRMAAQINRTGDL